MSDASVTAHRIVEDATCLCCACLCDDIGLVLEGDRIVEARRACDSGRAWYKWAQADIAVGPMIAGESASFDRTVDRAAEVLAGARAPVVLGLGSTIEAQRAAVAIADRIGAAIDARFDGPVDLASLQKLGAITATLGEIRDRADVLIFDSPGWPASLPRFVERFVDAPGRFIPLGRAGRTVIVLRDRDRESLPDEEWATRPDLIFDAPDRRAPIYATLRALVNGVSLDPVEFERVMRDPLDRYVDLAERLKRAKYGVLVYGSGRLPSVDAAAALALVRDLNRFTRFIALAPPVSGFGAGDAVLAWQTGAAGEVDFSRGYPRHLPREDVNTRIDRGEVDAVLFVGDVSWRTEILIDGIEMRLGAIPKILVGPIMPETGVGWDGDPDGDPPWDRERGVLAADAFLPTARAGIDEGGTVSRFDGVMLPLRPPFPGRRPSQAEVLRAIDARLASKIREESLR